VMNVNIRSRFYNAKCFIALYLIMSSVQIFHTPGCIGSF
jgi:hypothetical protein